MRGLNGKNVIVTGGAGAIGSAICRRFAEYGAKVGVFDKNLDGAKKVAGEIRGFACGADITDYKAVADGIAAFEKDAGPTDILVNNAGWDTPMPFLKTDEAFWKKVTAINWFGPLHMTHAVVTGMAARKSGRVVNIASDAARVGSSGEAVYAACKSGLLGLSKTLAREHARHGISVNVVCPGPTDTALFAEYRKGAGNPEKLDEAFRRSIPMGRIGVPADLPGAICFFASEDAAYITGQVLSVSGGLTMAG